MNIRSLNKDELPDFFRTCRTAFSGVLSEEETERWGKVLEPDRAHAAFEDDVMIGTAGAFTFQLSVPGGDVPAAGVTMVGVLPSHRRRGVLRRLMQTQLLDVAERGEGVAILWASEAAIYPRFGYGLAATSGVLDADRNHAAWRDDSGPTGRVRMIEISDALKTLPAVYERARRYRAGLFSRTHDWWESHRLAESKDVFCAVWESGGVPEAYALYRVKPHWGPDGIPSGELEVIEEISTSPVGHREIWRFLFGVDLVGRIKAWHVPIDTPLLLQIADPRRLRISVHDALYLRVVDVPAALTARTYVGEGTLTLELRDELLATNAGRHALKVSDGRAEATKTAAPPDLRMDIVDLGSVYLGGFTFAHLRRAGRVEEMSEGAVARADALFRTDIAPFCPEIF
jgi:predicted acetyltransferase